MYTQIIREYNHNALKTTILLSCLCFSMLLKENQRINNISAKHPKDKRLMNCMQNRMHLFWDLSRKASNMRSAVFFPRSSHSISWIH